MIAFAPHFYAAFARCLGALALLPLGWGMLPVIGRVVMACVLALFYGSSSESLTTTQGVWFDLGSEFVFGVTLSLPIVFTVMACELSGELTDAARGQTLAQAYSPYTDVAQSTTAALLKNLAIAQFFLLGLSERWIALIGSSFQTVRRVRTLELDGLILKLLTQGLAASFEVALPLLLCFIIFEVVAGLLNKTINVSFSSEVFQLKTYFALLIFVALQSTGINQGLARSVQQVNVLIHVEANGKASSP